jgi:protein O-mannosyl-transferase
LLPALLLTLLITYQPAWHGGMLWDDDGHITRQSLRSADGLRRIWFEFGATQQYYPVVHSVFWMEHRLWGDDTLGYHLANIILHFFSACLVWAILRKLEIPGSLLAAAIFALHPVHVESVAWMTELKNTLSGLFYLGALLVYLRFDKTRERSAYFAAFILFVLALLSKSVTVTLPAGLLVIFWWRRGSISWRRDVQPLAAFFLTGLAAGLLTIWMERVWIGARGTDFQFNLIERTLIAGRAIWFYLAKLILPVNLIFIYPRWQISMASWWQYLFPAAAFALIAGLFRLRNRSRAPLAAVLYFCGTLFPALGFIDAYPFRFSFVADHFQYLASLPMIALFAAALAGAAQRWGPRATSARIAAGLILTGGLAALSWSQSRQYADAETLYTTTLIRNPSCWMARSNLGTLKLRDKPDEAIASLEEALRLKPDLPEAHNNLGSALLNAGRPREALARFERALQLKPDSSETYNNLGFAFRSMGRLADAITACEHSLQLRPDFAEAHNNLGNALQASGRLDEAMVHYRAAMRLNPDLAEPRYNEGVVAQAQGKLEEAAAYYRDALQLKPEYLEAHYNLGNTLQTLGRLDEAETQYRVVLRIKPEFADAVYNLGNILRRMGRAEEAIARYQEALRLNPKLAAAHYNMGYALESRDRLEEAAQQYREALRIDQGLADAHYNLGNVLQKMGRPGDAAAQFREAIKARPQDAEAYNNLGSALEDLGRWNEAAAQYQEALRLKPDFEAARTNLSRLANLVKKRL